MITETSKILYRTLVQALWKSSRRIFLSAAIASRCLLVFLIILYFLSFSACNEMTDDIVIGVIPDEQSSSDGSDDDGGGGSDPPADDDGDGLSNQVEELFEIQPRTADTDHDGFDDGLEFVGDQGDPLAGGRSPTPFNRSRILRPEDVVRNDPDRDLDGLGDSFERNNSMDPESRDMDEDGYNDGLELVAGSDPFRSTSRPERDAPPAWDGVNRDGVGPADSDADGMSNDLEALNGTLRNQADTDGDGFSDGLEYLMGSDGTDFTSIPNFSVPLPPDDDNET